MNLNVHLIKYFCCNQIIFDTYLETLMPNIKSAIKRVSVTEKKDAANIHKK